MIQSSSKPPIYALRLVDPFRQIQMRPQYNEAPIVYNFCLVTLNRVDLGWIVVMDYGAYI